MLGEADATIDGIKDNLMWRSHAAGHSHAAPDTSSSEQKKTDQGWQS